jgi:hypothetical protein
MASGEAKHFLGLNRFTPRKAMLPAEKQEKRRVR